MSTPPLSDQPIGLSLRNSTSNGASRKRKAEETLPSPCYRRQWLPNQPAVMTPAISPTHLSSPIPNCQLSPQSNDAAFSSRIQRAIDSSFHDSKPSTVPDSKNNPIKDNEGMTDISRTVNMTSEFNTSRHGPSTRSLTDSRWFGACDTSQEISKATAEISETMEARRWLYFIDYRLRKIFHELAQIESAAVEAARTTKTMFLFSNNIYHLKEQIILFHMCQQHKVEESYGEQAFLRLKLRDLQELSDLQADSIPDRCSHSVYRPPEETNTAICRALFSG